jgi:hypothetical protein
MISEKLHISNGKKLLERFTNTELDVFQIMPNHIHGIIILTDAVVGATLAVVPDDMVAQNDADVAGAGFTPAHNDNLVRNERRAGQAPPLRKPLATLLGHINHWWQMVGWYYSNKKIRMK